VADLVLAIGTSHGPTMESEPEKWLRMGERDMNDPRMAHMGLRDRSGYESQLAPELLQERKSAITAAVQQVRRRLHEADVDVLVVVSNPHTIRPDDFHPVFGLYVGAGLPVPTKFAEPLGGASVSSPELAVHLVDSLVCEGFDVGLQKEYGEGVEVQHSYSVMAQHYLAVPTPLVPFTLSRYLPNQATPDRCYDLGRALRRAIESWDTPQRVALVASGGLSHQLVDEELDRLVVEAMQDKDEQVLRTLPRDRLNQAPGTPEILNWVVVAAAAESMPMTLAAYLPCYRSAAGTGHGVAYAYWEPSPVG
jgi:aromatic ring-opening dioxygenase catalytic subunit (LigB family)